MPKPDNRHPVKVIRKFIKFIKHTVTEEIFPFDNLSKFFTLSAWLLAKEWHEVKGDPALREQFIQKLRNAESECKDKEYLKNPRKDKDGEND